ncbi:MAG: 50S ribosomal protein L11 [Candidatus Pacearchaeota archaeon]|nr:50S ribosomal protein L11 [Candidatus Pacearchaeota archaeon]
MQIKLLVQGGEMKPGPALSQKLGPLGINIGKIISEINNATKEYVGMKVPVLLEIDKNKNVKIEVLTPPVSELLKKEIGIEKGSPMPNKIKVANIPLELVIKIAKIKEKDMFVSDFKAAVKSVLGSCVSLGVLVENKEPKEIIKDIEKGVYDELIQEKKDKSSEEKIKRLASYFEEVKKKQESIVKEFEEKREKAKATKT